MALFGFVAALAVIIPMAAVLATAPQDSTSLPFHVAVTFDGTPDGDWVISLDELDHKIIERLGHDARVSNREIGREFDLTEGTIRSRLKRLLDNRVIRVAAVTNVRLGRAETFARSRGALVADFVVGTVTASSYLDALPPIASARRDGSAPCASNIASRRSPKSGERKCRGDTLTEM